jgi:hypothetical protein
MVVLLLLKQAASGGDCLQRLAQPGAETQFIEEEEAGDSTAESDAVSATGSVFQCAF